MYSKHKDAPPADTVKRIRQIYTSIGLEMECRIEKHIDGIYSAYIRDPCGGWNTAGKGTSKAYCIASAYGESIEHICNHFAFDLSRTEEAAKRHLGFLRYPDEMLLPIRDVRHVAPEVYRDMDRCFTPDASNMTLEEVWVRVLGAEETPFTPYFSVTQQKTVLLPDAILSKLCGSNGGGSGNTPEEAIGHALDEVIERYAKYEIIYGQLTPPTVPTEYIQSRCPELFDLITHIERKSGLSVVVKDASIGKGYSVICILVIDTKCQRYLANFGAHPCFEIALERCLTEIFQDHACVDELLKREEMTPWENTDASEIFGLKNWVSLLRDDIGKLPDSLFGVCSTWDFMPWPIYAQYTNQIGMRHQLEILQKNGMDVYIRNNSFLGFPVYRIYIPFASTSHLRYDQAMVEEMEVGDQIYAYLEYGISHEQKQRLCSRCFGPDRFMLEMTLRNWDAEGLLLLYAAALFDIGHPFEAYAVLTESTSPEALFLRRYIELTNSQSTDRDELLRRFFGTAATAWLDALTRGNAFSIVQQYCAQHGLIKTKQSTLGATSASRDALYMRVKEAFQNVPIDQTDTAGLVLP